MLMSDAIRFRFCKEGVRRFLVDSVGLAEGALIFLTVPVTTLFSVVEDSSSTASVTGLV